MTATTRPDFVDGISRVSLRADNPDVLAADLRADGYRDEPVVFDALHHLVDPTQRIHFLAYKSSIVKAFAPSWSILRPVLTGLVERGQVR